MKLETHLKIRDWLLKLDDKRLERFSIYLNAAIFGVISIYFLFYFISTQSYQEALLVVAIRSLWRIERLLRRKLN
jgi:hypothetical protein